MERHWLCEKQYNWKVNNLKKEGNNLNRNEVERRKEKMGVIKAKVSTRLLRSILHERRTKERAKRRMKWQMCTVPPWRGVVWLHSRSLASPSARIQRPPPPSPTPSTCRCAIETFKLRSSPPYSLLPPSLHSRAWMRVGPHFIDSNVKIKPRV